MQDPGGDGKIVYLFLPLYKVKMTVSVRCFPMPALPRLGVQRTVLVALEYIIPDPIAYGLTVSQFCVWQCLVWSPHTFRWTLSMIIRLALLSSLRSITYSGILDITKPPSPLVRCFSLKVTTADSH